jgi:hypothetical protein
LASSVDDTENAPHRQSLWHSFADAHMRQWIRFPLI